MSASPLMSTAVNASPGCSGSAIAGAGMWLCRWGIFRSYPCRRVAVRHCQRSESIPRGARPAPYCGPPDRPQRRVRRVIRDTWRRGCRGRGEACPSRQRRKPSRATARARHRSRCSTPTPTWGGCSRPTASRRRGTCSSPAATPLPAGPWADPQLARVGGAHLGLLVLDGLLAHETVMEDTVSTHLLGQGDIARPWQADDPGQLLRAERRWTVLVAGEWSRCSTRASAPRSAATRRCTRRSSTASPSRCSGWRSPRPSAASPASTGGCSRSSGTSRSAGAGWRRRACRCRCNLAHGVLADLVGARRPTVSTALGKLATRGELVRLPDGSWLLHRRAGGRSRGARRRGSSTVAGGDPRPCTSSLSGRAPRAPRPGPTASGSSTGGGLSLGSSGVAIARATTHEPERPPVGRGEASARRAARCRRRRRPAGRG